MTGTMADQMMTYAALGVSGIIAVLVCLWMSPAQRLAVAVFLAVPQLFFPGAPVSLAEAWTALMGLLALLDKRVRLEKAKFLVPIFALTGLYLLAQVWSAAPFSQTNMLIIFRVLGFAVLAAYALSVASDDQKGLLRAFRWAVPWIIVQAVLTLSFRFTPALERQFYGSQIGDFLVGPAAAGLTNGFANNVLDPVKSGGLYVNANVASMFLGVAFFLLLAAIRAGASRWYYVWAVLSWGAVWATGSKTGAALAIALPVAAFLIPRMARGISRLVLLIAACIMVPLAMNLPNFIAKVFPAYADNSAISFGSRSALWEAAGILFERHPIMGLGFDGWSANIGALLGFNTLPPHNMIIAAWANAGVLAAAAIVAFLLVVATAFMSKILATDSAETRKYLTYALMALAWISIHSMGDNTTFYGEIRTSAFAAVGLAYYLAARAEPESPALRGAGARQAGDVPRDGAQSTVKTTSSTHTVPSRSELTKTISA